jgi:hypothetical protein
VREAPKTRKVAWLVGGLIGLVVLAAGITLGSILLRHGNGINGNLISTINNVAINLTDTLEPTTGSASTLETTDLPPVATSTSSPVVGETILPAPTGTLLWSDDFNDGFTHGFSFHGGDWRVVDDGTGIKVLQVISPTSCCATTTFGPDNISDGIVEFRFRVISADYQAQKYFLFINYRFSTPNGEITSYYLTYIPYPEGPVLFLGYSPGTGASGDRLEGTSGSGSIPSQVGDWTTLRVELKGKNMRVFVDENLMISAYDSRIIQGALQITANGPLVVQFDDFKVWDFAQE